MIDVIQDERGNEARGRLRFAKSCVPSIDRIYRMIFGSSSHSSHAAFDDLVSAHAETLADVVSATSSCFLQAAIGRRRLRLPQPNLKPCTGTSTTLVWSTNPALNPVQRETFAGVEPCASQALGCTSIHAPNLNTAATSGGVRLRPTSSARTCDAGRPFLFTPGPTAVVSQSRLCRSCFRHLPCS